MLCNIEAVKELSQALSFGQLTVDELRMLAHVVHVFQVFYCYLGI